MAKTLVLVRHAHRDTSQRELDNGLTEKGKEQSRYVRRFFAERFTPEDFKKGLWLVSSPKVRCVETLQPIAKLLERAVDVHPGLDEQGPRESHSALEQRVLSFLKEWAQSRVELTVVCSHGDWLPLAVAQLLKLDLEPKKGSWLEIEEEAGTGVLKWYIPSFKHFFK